MKSLYRVTVLAVIAAMLTLHTPAEAETVARTVPAPPLGTGFRFISWGDGQHVAANLHTTAIQAAALNPAFTIFNGDLEQDGFTSAEMGDMVTAMGSLYGKTFLVRGNHDDHMSGSATAWENYLTAANRPLPTGVSHYTALGSNATYLTYSFDYGNSRFIGVDVPGDTDLLTGAQATFIDARLTDAEATGLTHAFLFFHGPEYCIANHCGCSLANDGSCTPGSIVALLNKHPIVSATFHGHEHFLAWVHMDSTRVAGLSGSYEEFFTSPSGGYTDYGDLHPARVDYYYPGLGDSQGFAAIDVNGASFTFNIYKDGTTSPVYSRTFTKTNAQTTATLRSTPAEDGWVLETRETSAVGGKLNAIATTLRLGDNARRRQFRLILSFNTGDLPDNAVLTNARLILRSQSAVPAGSNPFNIFRGLMIDVRSGFFGASPGLEPSDFQFNGPAITVGPFKPAAVDGQYKVKLPGSVLPYINTSSSNGGLTQLRLRFKPDDNNDSVANYISFYSGDHGIVNYQPALVIAYYLP